MPTSKGLIKRDSTYISLNMSPEALIKAMRVHGLTATKVIKPIADALNADKVVVRKRMVERENGDVVEEEFVDSEPDHNVRLKAAQIGIELLGLKKAKSIPNKEDNDSKAITKALKGMDEVELQRAVFRKQETDRGDK